MSNVLTIGLPRSSSNDQPGARSMNRATQDRSILVRVSKPAFLVVTILVVFQGITAAQNNSEPETGVHPKSASATPASDAIKPFKIRLDGRIRDLIAVRKHDIGCSFSRGNQHSLQTQIEMGRSYAQQIEATSQLVTDPIITEYVNRIGQKLARNSDAQVQHTFKIIDTNELKAFSTPGGFVFVDSGLILAAENEAELAGVLSHEIAHVAGCHVMQGIGGEDLLSASRMPLILRILLRPAVGSTVYSNPSRNFESEADLLAIEYLYKAGYDPHALAAFLKKVGTIEKQRVNRANASASYPKIADRIRKAQREIDNLPPAARKNRLDTSEFHDVKNRLAELENHSKKQVEKR